MLVRETTRIGKALIRVQVGVLALGLAACAAPSGNLAPVSAGGLAKAPPAAPSSGRPVYAVAQLIAMKSLSQPDLLAKLGKPDFTRRDPPAEIWQYRSASCVLDIFFYPEGDQMRVLHAATRDRARLQAPTDACTPFAPAQSASN